MKYVTVNFHTDEKSNGSDEILGKARFLEKICKDNEGTVIGLSDSGPEGQWTVKMSDIDKVRQQCLVSGVYMESMVTSNSIRTTLIYEEEHRNHLLERDLTNFYRKEPEISTHEVDSNNR